MHAGGVPLGPRAPFQKTVRFRGCQGLAVGAVRGHGRVGVGNSQQAGERRDGLADQPAGIARAIPALVVVPDGTQNLFQARGAGSQCGGDDRRPDVRVHLDLRELFVGQAPRLAKDLVGDADLADIVQQGGDLYGVLRRLVQTQDTGDVEAVAHDVLGVAARVAVLVVHGRHQGVQHREAGDRAAQDAAHPQSVGVHLRAALGAQQALVGDLHDGQPGRGLGREQGDACRQADGDSIARARRAAADVADARGQPRPHCLRRGVRADIGHQQGELVAPEPGQAVARPAGGPQDARDLVQHFIPHGMTVNVIEELEVVQVQHHDRKRRAVSERPFGLFFQPLVEHAVVQQAGQGVLLGLRPCLVQQASLRADVAVDGEDGLLPPINHLLERAAGPERRAVGAARLDLPVLDMPALGERLGQAVAVGGGDEEPLGGPPEDFLVRRDSEEVVDVPVGIEDLAVRPARNRHRDRAGLGDRAQPGLALAQGRLSPAARGDVLGDAVKADDRPIHDDGDFGDGDLDASAALVEDGDLLMLGLAAQGPRHDPLYPVPVFGDHEGQVGGTPQFPRAVPGDRLAGGVRVCEAPLQVEAKDCIHVVVEEGPAALLVLFQPQTPLAALGHVLKKEGKTVGAGINPAAEPESVGSGESLELEHLLCPRRLAAGRVTGLRKIILRRLAEQVRASALKDLGSLFVDVGDAPFRVEGEETITDPVQDGRHTGIEERKIGGMSISSRHRVSSGDDKC